MVGNRRYQFFLANEILLQAMVVMLTRVWSVHFVLDRHVCVNPAPAVAAQDRGRRHVG